MKPDIPWSMYPGMLHQVSPKQLRYKLWRLHSEIVRAHCIVHGITFIESPPEALDAEGFLKPEYYLDGAHANTAYGQLVLNQMEALA